MLSIVQRKEALELLAPHVNVATKVASTDDGNDDGKERIETLLEDARGEAASVPGISRPGRTTV